MSLNNLLLALALLVACDPTDTCLYVDEEGPGLTGLASYTLGDGTELDTDLGTMGYTETRAGTITIHSSFTDSFAHERKFELRLTGMAVGSFDLEGRASLCMQRMTSGPEVCSPVTGTIEIRELDEDCNWHESGIGSCADTVDFTIHAESVWQTTRLVLDGEMKVAGRWVEEEC